VATGYDVDGPEYATRSKAERSAEPMLEPRDVGAAQPAQHRRPEAPMSAGTPEAVLRATQMAIRGEGRAEIEAVLTEEFGIANPADLADQILGATPE
jgi:hypothetical protein